MKFKTVWISIGLLCGLAGGLLLVCLSMTPEQQSFDDYSLPKDMQVLDQNWSPDMRQQMHYVSFGSKLMPYDIFTNIEVADSTHLLSGNHTMTKLGFITQKPARNNPDGLPIGFAIESKSSNEKWIGLTCTSCHTGAFTYQGTEVLVEGGPGFLDFNGLESTVSKALDAALASQDKFSRLSSRMGLTSDEQKEDLRARLVERANFFRSRIEINAVSVPYGYARLDAFGRIFNAVTATALNMPMNHHTPDAPVSIPMLWDASHLDLVQWNASAPNKNPGPLGQNVTTVLGVYGQIDIEEGSFGYSSSVDILNLGYIQSQYYKLRSPLWPSELLGQVDAQKVAQGKQLYADNCVECHAIIDRNSKDRKLRAKPVPVSVVGTDPLMAKNFVDFRSSTGPLQGEKEAFIAGPRFSAEARTIDIVVNAAFGSMLRQPLETLSAFIAEDRSVYSAPEDMDSEVYKARSLNGIWATGPFLHNGSVPTLYDLLQTPDKRPATFFVGSRELDPIKVGYHHEQTEFSSLFDTTLAGNSNAGHLFGTALSHDQKWALIEYLKTL